MLPAGHTAATARQQAGRAVTPRPRTGAIRKARNIGSKSRRNMPPARPVRGRPWKADGYTDRATGPDAVRYASVDTATHRLTVTHTDTRRDKKETARLAENSQLAGRFRRWWQVLGSNQRRLSRRFYRPLSFCTSQSAADQRICAGRMRFSISCASMTSEFEELARPRSGSRESTDGAGGSGCCDWLTSVWRTCSRCCR